MPRIAFGLFADCSTYHIETCEALCHLPERTEHTWRQMRSHNLPHFSCSEHPQLRRAASGLGSVFSKLRSGANVPACERMCSVRAADRLVRHLTPMQPAHACSRAAHAHCSIRWLVARVHSHVCSALLTADARGAEVMASTGKSGKNIVLSNTNENRTVTLTTQC